MYNVIVLGPWIFNGFNYHIKQIIQTFAFIAYDGNNWSIEKSRQLFVVEYHAALPGNI